MTGRVLRTSNGRFAGSTKGWRKKATTQSAPKPTPSPRSSFRLSPASKRALVRAGSFAVGYAAGKGLSYGVKRRAFNNAASAAMTKKLNSIPSNSPFATTKHRIFEKTAWNAVAAETRKARAWNRAMLKGTGNANLLRQTKAEYKRIQKANKIGRRQGWL